MSALAADIPGASKWKFGGKLIGNPEVRRWLYSIGIALSALLAAIGIIDNNIVAPVNVLLAAVFGIALTNTSNDKED